MRWVVALLASACGRIGFAPAGAPSDAPSDASGPVWAGDFTMEAPARVAELSTGENESECFVVPDGTRMYFARFGMTDHQLFTATRTFDTSFTNVTPLTELTTSSDEGRLVTIDGLRAYFWSVRPGGGASEDIWTVSRPTVDAPFANANAQRVAGLDSPQPEYDPWPAGSRLYYMIESLESDLYVADLVNATATAGTARLSVSSQFNEDNPTVTPDELVLVWGSDRPGGTGGFDLWYARRPDRTAEFGPAQPLPVVNSPTDDNEACITWQGELFFSSKRDGGDYDLYRSRFIPL